MVDAQLGSGRRVTTVAVALIASVLVPGTACAQSATVSDRVNAIERQIRALQAELNSVKAELRRSRAEAGRSRAQQDSGAVGRGQEQGQEIAVKIAAPHSAPVPHTPPSKPHVVETPEHRFGLESADGRNSIYLTGRLHLDFGDYLDYRPASQFASVQDLNSGVNARRARLGFTGKVAGDWRYTLIYDFGGSSDGLPPTPGAPSSGIENAFVTYNGFNKGALPLAFDLGYMDTPFTLDEATSSNDIMFVERPSVQVIASSIFAGDYRSAFGVRSNDARYWTGLYLTGPQSGATHNTGEQMGAFGRATYQIIQQPGVSFHIGIDLGGLLKPPAVGGVRTITLSDRPELRIDPTTILTTGALGTAANPVNDAAVYGVEAAVSWRSLFLQGEYYHISVDRTELPSNGFDGWYVEGSWTITGEHRKYIPATGAYSAIVPEHPFEPWGAQYLGAFELAARYSTIDLNDHFSPGVPPGLSGAVGGGTQTVYQVGLNWYPNSNIRFMFDALHADISKDFSPAAGGGIVGTPLGIPVGGNMDAVVMRSQVAF